MGLDMYLEGERYLWGDRDKDTIHLINGRFFPPELTNERDPANFGRITAKAVIFRVAYWRKANHIHGWFVRNCQAGVDNCARYHVERKKLEELRDLCRVVLADPDGAQSLLPTESGFFFGSTAYDEYYREDLEYTVGRLSILLDNPAFANFDFYYRSSW